MQMVHPLAPVTLRNFCKWQSAGNRRIRGQHDVSILLTRENLCRVPNSCDTLGLAILGQICDPSSSCAVIEDNGTLSCFYHRP